MLFRQGFLFKLKPNGRQARLMSRFAGCCRFVYHHRRKTTAFMRWI